jgi:hypothetical protein
MRSTEVRWVARVVEIRIERRAPALALFLEYFAHVLRERLDVDRRDSRLSFQHRHLHCFAKQIGLPQRLMPIEKW